ncbi:GNAT family N-acetyltransferase [Halobacterium sp. CBA1126]|uniref:GNAT family N-acetyltransferase n=1 Tax=Halobacterium sp. CBA1126 TaxID=2668074 RepID=UPI0012FCB92E|nr:GNAT family N-acetyltransferase [Halobacterium sp. CBA1126]MUV60931.1 GNAT family N-acetyltransferase [Halobacterium sp. CBA1126]
MDVTAAAGEDVGAVTELWVALAREQRDHDSHLLAGENREQARDLVAQYVHTGDCAVARTGGQPVGFVMFHVETGFFETDATRGVVDNVYVLPEARGDGVGSALLDYAEAQLREDGADTLAVEALWDNEAARRLYERRGYAPHRVTLEKSVDGGNSDVDGENGDAAGNDDAPGDASSE